MLACLDGYMNIAMEQTEEYVDGQLKSKYGDCFIRGNNGRWQRLHVVFQTIFLQQSYAHTTKFAVAIGSAVHFEPKEIEWGETIDATLMRLRESLGDMVQDKALESASCPPEGRRESSIDRKNGDVQSTFKSSRARVRWKLFIGTENAGMVLNVILVFIMNSVQLIKKPPV